MVAPLLKTTGLIVLGLLGYKAYKESSDNKLAERTDKIAKESKGNLVSHLETLTSEGKSSWKGYYDSLLGAVISESDRSWPVFARKDKEFRFLGKGEEVFGSEKYFRKLCADDVTICTSSVIVKGEPIAENDPYKSMKATHKLVHPIILGKDQNCQDLHEAILRDQVDLARQKKLQQVYNVPVFQCQNETPTTYASCTRVGDLMDLPEEFKEKIEEGKFTPCHFRSMDQPVTGFAYHTDYGFANHGKDGIFLELPSDVTCEDLKSGKIRCRDIINKS